MAESIDQHLDEDAGERHDRQLMELLNELRVALPGVQVLFAFLLVVPFQQRFGELTAFQEKLYFAALLLATASSALLIAPTAYHRELFKKHQKQHVIAFGTRCSIAGLACLALSMAAAVTLITDVLFAPVTVAIVAGVTVAIYAWLWFGLGLLRRAQL